MLPPWDDSTSDGCTNAPWFSAIPEVLECCKRHDAKYYYGGSWRDRLKADRDFYDEIIATGKIDQVAAEAAFTLIRAFGGPNGRHPKYSWAFGGDVFAYTDGSDCEHLR